MEQRFLSPSAGVRLKVLLVEDSDTARAVVRDLLAQEEPTLELDEARDIATAIQALRERSYDCALVDYVLPDGHGLALLGASEDDEAPAPAVVMLTAMNDHAMAMQALQGGAQDYLVKGRFDGPTLSRSIRYAIERKKAAALQLRLVHVERMVAIGTLTAGVAHEINNPLAYVMGNLSCLSEALATLPPSPRTEDMKDMVRDALQGSERVRSIVRDMRAFSRREDHDVRIPLQVEKVLEQALAMAGVDLRHRAGIVRQFSPVPPVLANETRLAQVFLNLLINAGQAIPEGRIDDHEVRLCIRESAGSVEVCVEDDGPGIAPEDLRRVFHPFYTTKPVGKGTGLGLFICDGIVRGLGGSIAIESTLGKGTKVRVRLPPHVERAAVRDSGVPQEGNRGRRGSLLVVDDDPQVLLVIRRILDAEHALTTTTSALDALRRIREGEPFDAMISDLMMPELSGMALYAEVQEISPALAAKTVFITGGAFTPPAREFLDTIANARLEKPFAARELRELVRGVVA
ncbi:MAG: response regulator [Myxococcales bacterium]